MTDTTAFLTSKHARHCVRRASGLVLTVYPEYQRAKTASGGAVDKYEIPNANLRAWFRNKYQRNVAEGMEMLQKALALDPNYDAAMAYMNLLYRLKAAMEDNPQDGATSIAEADEWVARAIQTKRKNETIRDAGSPKLDPNGPPPGPATSNRVIIKAPPPPPPPAPPKTAERIASAVLRPASEQLQMPPGAQFWQVVGSSEMSAIMLYRQLTTKGFEGVIHNGSDHNVRVLAGPYFDQAAATEAKSRLETAGFRVVSNWR